MASGSLVLFGLFSVMVSPYMYALPRTRYTCVVRPGCATVAPGGAGQHEVDPRCAGLGRCDRHRRHEQGILQCTRQRSGCQCRSWAGRAHTSAWTLLIGAGALPVAVAVMAVTLATPCPLIVGVLASAGASAVRAWTTAAPPTLMMGARACASAVLTDRRERRIAWPPTVGPNALAVAVALTEMTAGFRVLLMTGDGALAAAVTTRGQLRIPHTRHAGR